MIWMSHPTGEDEANGGSTSTTYDSEGFPVAVTDALGPNRHLHLPLFVATPNGKFFRTIGLAGCPIRESRRR